MEKCYLVFFFLLCVPFVSAFYSNDFYMTVVDSYSVSGNDSDFVMFNGATDYTRVTVTDNSGCEGLWGTTGAYCFFYGTNASIGNAQAKGNVSSCYFSDSSTKTACLNDNVELKRFCGNYSSRCYTTGVQNYDDLYATEIINGTNPNGKLGFHVRAYQDCGGAGTYTCESLNYNLTIGDRLAYGYKNSTDINRSLYYDYYFQSLQSNSRPWYSVDISNSYHNFDTVSCSALMFGNYGLGETWVVDDSNIWGQGSLHTTTNRSVDITGTVTLPFPNLDSNITTSEFAVCKLNDTQRCVNDTECINSDCDNNFQYYCYSLNQVGQNNGSYANCGGYMISPMSLNRNYYNCYSDYCNYDTYVSSVNGAYSGASFCNGADDTDLVISDNWNYANFGVNSTSADLYTYITNSSYVCSGDDEDMYSNEYICFTENTTVLWEASINAESKVWKNGDDIGETGDVIDWLNPDGQQFCICQYSGQDIDDCICDTLYKDDVWFTITYDYDGSSFEVSSVSMIDYDAKGYRCFGDSSVKNDIIDAIDETDSIYHNDLGLTGSTSRTNFMDYVCNTLSHCSNTADALGSYYINATKLGLHDVGMKVYFESGHSYSYVPQYNQSRMAYFNDISGDVFTGLMRKAICHSVGNLSYVYEYLCADLECLENVSLDINNLCINSTCVQNESYFYGVSGEMNLSGYCVFVDSSASCFNGVLDGNETDIDYGGSCGSCDNVTKVKDVNWNLWKQMYPYDDFSDDVCSRSVNEFGSVIVIIVIVSIILTLFLIVVQLGMLIFIFRCLFKFFTTVYKFLMDNWSKLNNRNK